MKIVPALIGGLPRPVQLAKNIEKYNNGTLSEEKLEEAYRRHTAKAYETLETIGIPVVTDPLYRWDDLFNPLIQFIDGVEVDGLYKFYENNFFYRAPVVKDRIRLEEHPIGGWAEINKELLEEYYPSATLKQVLPGPLTLASHSVDRYYHDESVLAEKYMKAVLLPLIRELKGTVDIIELHEPVLCLEKKEEHLTILKEITERSPIKTWVVTYFGEPTVEGIEKINTLINVDVIESKGKILEKLEGEVGIGIVDARQTKLEDKKELKDRFRSLSNKFSTVYVTPNTLLDFLPERVAFKKLRLLRTVTGGE